MFYQLYFLPPGVADAELARDARKTIQSMLFAASGDRGDPTAFPKIYMVNRGGGFLDRLPNPDRLPPWLTEPDIDHYTAAFETTGFTGGLNWYRAQDISWELLAPFAGLEVKVPALYMIGDRDVVMSMLRIEPIRLNLIKFVPQIRDLIVLPGCGHWTQQERPQEVNAAMIAFLASLD
jgi:pimeloyl-ACP methyl ester carboxylesterase